MALTKVPSNLDSITATTQSASDNSTNVATTAYVTTAVSNIVDGAPSTLNTLNEIAAALNDDAALNTTLTTSIATKLPLAGGTLTGALTGKAVTLAPDTAGKLTIRLTTNAANDGRILLRSDTTDKVDIQANGASYFNGGNVGIGTATPNANLDTQLSGNGGLPVSSGTSQTYGSLRVGATAFNTVLDMGTAGATGAWLQASDRTGLGTNYSILLNPNGGNVGIGATTPGYKLEVNGTAHVVNTLTAGAIGIPSQGITLNQAFGTGVPSITMTGTANNGRAGAINFKESDGSGGAIANTAAIYSTDGAGGNANYGGLTIATYQSDLKFATSALASTRMTIDSSGRVSFGPNAADIQIDPASTNSNNNIIYMRGNTTGDKSEIQLNHYGHADYHIGVGHVANGTFNISNDQTGNNFVIDTSGRVGIGKTNPSGKLHVVSTGSASYDSTSAGSNIALYLVNEESGAANRTIGIGLVSETNGEIYLNAVTNSINNGSDFYIATRHAGTRRRRFQIMSDGRQINMNQAIVTTNEGVVINMGFMPHAAAYGSGTTSGRYLHMKLTQPAGGVSASGVNVMGRYEYKGFAYGSGFLDCGCSFYTYVGTSTPYAFYSNNQGAGNGMSAYYSSDNKVVIVVDIIANNYSGGILYFQAGSTHYITDNQVASINYSANTTGVF